MLRIIAVMTLMVEDKEERKGKNILEKKFLVDSHQKGM